MTGRKKSVSRKKIGGRKGGIWESRKGQHRLKQMAERRDVHGYRWGQAPDSDNAMHQVKPITTGFGIRMLRWRGEYTDGGNRQSGFMVGRDGDILYKGPDQNHAWSIYRSELGARKKVIQQATREAESLAVLGNNPYFKDKIMRLLLAGEYNKAAFSLEGYAEAFMDESIMGGVRDAARKLEDMAGPMDHGPAAGTIMESPYPYSEEYYRELAARERFDAGPSDDILHFDEDDIED